MRTVWQSLLWKEWHEHKWKLLALVAIVVGRAALHALLRGQTVFHGAITWTLVAYAFLSALFIGMGTAAGENASKTMPFLQALPVPMWKAAAAKLLGASVTVVTPIVMVVGLAFLGYHVGGWLDRYHQRHLELNIGRVVFHPWGIERLVRFAFGGRHLAAVSLLVWVVAAGVNRRDEIRAGAIAVLVFVGAWFLVSYMAKWETEMTGSEGPGPLLQIAAVSVAGRARASVGGLRHAECVEWLSSGACPVGSCS